MASKNGLAFGWAALKSAMGAIEVAFIDQAFAAIVGRRAQRRGGEPDRRRS